MKPYRFLTNNWWTHGWSITTFTTKTWYPIRLRLPGSANHWSLSALVKNHNSKLEMTGITIWKRHQVIINVIVKHWFFAEWSSGIRQYGKQEHLSVLKCHALKNLLKFPVSSTKNKPRTSKSTKTPVSGHEMAIWQGKLVVFTPYVTMCRSTMFFIWSPLGQAPAGKANSQNQQQQTLDSSASSGMSCIFDDGQHHGCLRHKNSIVHCLWLSQFIPGFYIWNRHLCWHI